MTIFQELDTYLSQDFSDDYWADDVSLYARELVKQLTTEDWDALKSSWQNRSNQWQVRCAEILDWGEARQAVPLLLEMIREEDDELTLTAADSLRSIGVAELDLPVGDDVLERLQTVAQTGSIAKRIINELLEQLKVKEYHRFLIEVLQITAQSNHDSQIVYQFLQAHLDKLNDTLKQVLYDWTTTTLPKFEITQAQVYAAAIVNFSTLIQHFPLGNRGSNLEIAITGYKVAVTVLTREAFPQDWATTQNNLGVAYRNRVLGERAENLETAIRFFLSALEISTRESFPQDWAETQSNLGSAYLERIRGEKAENLEMALRYFLAALEKYNYQAFPREWAIIQNNLGNAYGNRILGERAENLEAAIHCFLAALEVSPRETLPEQWAILQINLGNAYLERIREEKVENLEIAIRCFLAAVEVLTRASFPQDWAGIQNNLGVAYRNRILGEKAENLETAIRCSLAALEVRTRDVSPQNYAQTQFNLGLAYQDKRLFAHAYVAFAAAIDTMEFLWSGIVSGDEARQKLTEEWNPLYKSMVEVCVMLHDYTKAIEYAKRSQARNLVELLANSNLYPEGKIPADILNELNRLRQEITRTPQLIDIEVERRRRGILTWKSA